MPTTYAILGATGNVGGAILKVLLLPSASDETQIHAYCRSKQKLVHMFPDILENKRVRIFEGSLDDSELLADCLDGTRAAFLAVAQTENKPGNSIAIDTAHSVVNALQLLRRREQQQQQQQGDHRTRPNPKLIVLSSASTEHRLMSHIPPLLLRILYAAFSNIYKDLQEAEEFLRATGDDDDDDDNDISATFIKPGALCVDEQRGHVLSMDRAKSPLSFLDLAAGMIEVADQEGYEWKTVAVNNATGRGASFPWDAPWMMARGLLYHCFPFLYAYI